MSQPDDRKLFWASAEPDLPNNFTLNCASEVEPTFYSYRSVKELSDDGTRKPGFEWYFYEVTRLGEENLAFNHVGYRYDHRWGRLRRFFGLADSIFVEFDLAWMK